MYCIKCGVELADSEKRCPLCGTIVLYPSVSKLEDAAKPYPKFETVSESVNRKYVLFIVTICFAFPFILTLFCDWRISGAITWSGYAAGGVCLAYILSVLPLWFSGANPVIFAPVDFAAIALFLFYINFATSGAWFVGFALPIIGYFVIIATAIAAIFRYVKKGYLYLFGSVCISIGGFMVLLEYLIYHTFGLGTLFIWSPYPLIACFLAGLLLIIIELCKPLKESLHKKFFL